MWGSLIAKQKKGRKKKMSTDSPSVSQPQTTDTTQATVSVSKPKKPKTPAQLAALAKGREAKKLKAKSAGVVRDDESATELVERVRDSDPEATVSSRSEGRKRKERGWMDSDSSGTLLKVAGVAAVAGLAFLGSKGVFSKGFPVATPPNTPAQQATTGQTGMNTGQPNGLSAASIVSLSGAPYIP
jgi:hypothetical protein